jgi:hypothetical protein
MQAESGGTGERPVWMFSRALDCAKACSQELTDAASGWYLWPYTSLSAKTRGRNCELTFERTVESGFGLIADLRCDPCH